MKKSLFALCACALLFAACKQDAPTLVGTITVAEGIETVVPTEGSIINVDFVSNVKWVAKLDVEADVASLNLTSGEAGEQRVKLTVMPLNEDNAKRSINLSLLPEGGDPAVITFTQSGPYVPYLSVSQDLYELGLEGGSVVITVDANTEYTYEVSDGVTVVEATTDEENIRTYTCTVEKNSTWQPLSFGAWFTVPAIQDPVLDDNGEPTDETKDHVERVSFSQASYAVFEYGVAIPESAFGAKKYSVAVVGDKLAVANGSTVVLFNKADGAFVQDLQVEGVWAITNDDAGNVLVITGDGAYPSEDNPNPVGLTFSVAPASSFTDTNTWVTINTYKNNIYGFGMDNPTVRGNLLEGDAVITLASSGGATYAVFFQFKDGKLMTDAGEVSELGKHTDYVTCPESSGGVWKAKLMAYICVSNKFNEGVLFSGYDGNYSLFYNPSTSRANWTTTGLAYGTSASAISYADIVEFDGKTLYIGLQMTLFPQWAMPSAIDVIDITDISAPQHLAEISYSNPDNTETAYNTAVLQCEKDGDNLAIYIVDGNQQSIAKLVLQPIK